VQLLIDYWIVSKLAFIVPAGVRRVFGLPNARFETPTEMLRRGGLDGRTLLQSETFASLFWFTSLIISMVASFLALVVCRVSLNGNFIHSPWFLLSAIPDVVFVFSIVEYIVTTIRARMLSNYTDSVARRSGSAAKKKKSFEEFPGRVIPKARDFWIGFVITAALTTVITIATA
jgi:hypothetical protein